jgi:hypothetical protein
MERKRKLSKVIEEEGLVEEGVTKGQGCWLWIRDEE